MSRIRIARLLVAGLLCAPSVRAAEIVLTGDITVDTTWTADNVYNLQGEVRVTNGATLVIEAGTVVASDVGMGGTLVVTRGSQLFVNGADGAPVIMTSKAEDYPDLFELHRDGDRWRWINRPMGIDDTFTFLDKTTLPYGPLEYITRQTQGDYAILDQRENDLWMDAGMVTTQADWSLDFDIGMSFMQWHAPVPLAHQLGVFDRALKFLLNLQQGAPVRRLNWTMTVNPNLDTSPENYHKWGPEKTTLTPENVGQKQHLRVELQTLWRLPRSNAMLFPIRGYLIRLEDIVTVPKWGRRLHRVLRDLPVELATYKGFIRNRPMIVEYLSQFDDGAPTSPGCFPD